MLLPAGGCCPVCPPATRHLPVSQSVLLRAAAPALPRCFHTAYNGRWFITEHHSSAMPEN